MKQRKIIDYLLVINRDASEVTAKVAARIKEGWQPFGGATIGSSHIAQALVKYEPKEPKEDVGPG